MDLKDAIFGTSLFVLLVLAARNSARERNLRSLFVVLPLLLACGAIYFLAFRTASGVQPKGATPPRELAFIVVLYVCTSLGMVAHFFYARFTKPLKARPRFDFGRFLAPLLVSPIVFIPVLAAFQSADVDLANLTLPKYMVFFVAFENGFFWKEVLENRMKGNDS
jgi:hypothetical protein